MNETAIMDFVSETDRMVQASLRYARYLDMLTAQIALSLGVDLPQPHALAQQP